MARTNANADCDFSFKFGSSFGRSETVNMQAGSAGAGHPAPLETFPGCTQE
jgi:hypothetical protein